eukprot:scaffold25278_cov132-Cylindrotheca_fusiformis.AAC.5
MKFYDHPIDRKLDWRMRTRDDRKPTSSPSVARNRAQDILELVNSASTPFSIRHPSCLPKLQHFHRSMKSQNRVNRKKKRGSKASTETQCANSTSKFSLPAISSFFLVPLLVVAIAIRFSKSPIEVEKSPEPLQKEKEKWGRPDPRISFLLAQACKVAQCHPYLQAVNRTLVATENIPPGEILFRIPRSIQLWDLDALRDPFIRSQLFEAKHKLSGNTPGNEAFLAAYLAVEMARSKQNYSNFNPVILAYFNALPTHAELQTHPFFCSYTDMFKQLGRSTAFNVFFSYRSMIISEYDAFLAASSEFGKLVSREAYYTARLNVLSRALRVGPPPPEEAKLSSFLLEEMDNQELLNDELMAYRDLLGIDLMDKAHGSIALIPVADLLNHHPRYSVGYRYQSEHSNEGSFILSTEHRQIERGYEPMISYGVLSDAHLFARYGFVNSDGSGHTDVSLAYHHDVLMTEQFNHRLNSKISQRFLKEQGKPISKYLGFDDGYENCIPGPASHPQEAKLKLLKFQHLLRISNENERWNMLVPPRNVQSLPPKRIYERSADTFGYVRQFLQRDFSIDNLLPTCRLISAINSDYEGRIVAMLKENLKNQSFVLERGNDDLEYRAWTCLARWFGTKYLNIEQNETLKAVLQQVKDLDNGEFGSQRWSASRVRYGETQALKSSVDLIMENVQATWGVYGRESLTYKMREESCPEENLEFLFESEYDSYF